ncbi:MAG: plastocyanin/azurin family copper-binding protein [Thaumarchaeota archaeon]|nr:plastocyanin/azurin family copper-binding protein [Nitrososphaerota archaeon]
MALTDQVTSRWRLGVFAATIGIVVLILGAAAISPSGPVGSPVSSTTTNSRTIPIGTTEISLPVNVGLNESLNFNPPMIRVVIGINSTVIWINDDPIQHTITSSSVPPGAKRFDSGILNEGQEFSVTFTLPGIYKYYCTIHPDWMRGTIEVVL